jgi:hypothetical protein
MAWNVRTLSTKELQFINLALSKISLEGINLLNDIENNDVNFPGAQLITELQYTIESLQNPVCTWTEDDSDLIIDHYTLLAKLYKLPFIDYLSTPIIPIKLQPSLGDLQTLEDGLLIERLARIAADLLIQANLDAEIQARIDADTLIRNVVRGAPIYTIPSASITNVAQLIEKGESLTNLTVNISFTQNDAGIANGYSLEKDNIEISTTQNNVITLSDIISNTILKGSVSYDEGNVKNDNFSEPYPTGKILAGTVTSSTITITPTFKNFLGFSSNTILTGPQITSLINSSLETVKAKNYTGVTAGSGNYLYYCYPWAYGNLSTIILDGASPILGAFTKLSNVSVTNQFGVTKTYIVYRSNAVNAFNNNSLNFS